MIPYKDFWVTKHGYRIKYEYLKDEHLGAILGLITSKYEKSKTTKDCKYPKWMEIARESVEKEIKRRRENESKICM